MTSDQQAYLNSVGREVLIFCSKILKDILSCPMVLLIDFYNGDLTLTHNSTTGLVVNKGVSAKDFIATPQASAPSTEEGMIYYDSVTKHFLGLERNSVETA